MNADTPITLAAARYSSRDAAVEGFDMVWDAHKGGEFDHTAVAVLTKDDSGKLQVERHDTTAKHLAWAGAALAVVAPGVGVVAGAGAGALVGHFHHNIPKKDVEAIGELLESGPVGSDRGGGQQGRHRHRAAAGRRREDEGRADDLG